MGTAVVVWSNIENHAGPSREEFFTALHSVPRRSPSTQKPSHKNHTHDEIDSGSTHTRELDAAVTALGSGTLLLQVKVPELTTRSLDDANLVGPRVVPV